MKYIFLDIDGVINAEKESLKAYVMPAPSEIDGYDPVKLKIIKKIVTQTNAKVIISSTWRKDMINDTDDGKFMKQAFASEKIKIYGYIEDIFKDGKEMRIEAIKRIVKPNDKFIIIDDNLYDANEDIVKNHFVKVDPKYGIIHKHIGYALELFNAQT